jgi:phosphoribosylformylglycinamidine synthase
VKTNAKKSSTPDSSSDCLRVAVLRFPGTNCEGDTFEAVGRVSGFAPEIVTHMAGSLVGFDAVIVPGGFSYGDYLRTGAIAAKTPVMKALAEFAAKGGAVLGICNGFQILAEAGLLPGILLENIGRKFICADTTLIIEQTKTPFTSLFSPGARLNLPIAHQEGRFYLDEKELSALEENQQVVMRYQMNPNGSMHDIAAISNIAGNVVGMMPHPERRSSEDLGSTEGLTIFTSLLNSLLTPSVPDGSAKLR